MSCLRTAWYAIIRFPDIKMLIPRALLLLKGPNLETPWKPRNKRFPGPTEGRAAMYLWGAQRAFPPLPFLISIVYYCVARSGARCLDMARASWTCPDLVWFDSIWLDLADLAWSCSITLGAATSMGGPLIFKNMSKLLLILARHDHTSLRVGISFFKRKMCSYCFA